MLEQLPISIIPCQELAVQFDKIKGVANKLEAQFNFQTMTANWYGDEEGIIFITLRVETSDSFAKVQQKKQATLESFSDDVFYIRNNQEKLLECFIAITQAELALLSQQGRVLGALLQIKLQKVLNLIAKRLHLTLI